MCDTVLIANGGMRSAQAQQDRSTTVARMAGLGHAQYEIPYGPLLISQYAMAARRHMYEFGTTAEQLAEIAVITRDNARRTPGAQMTAPIAIDDVLNSRWISEPLHLLDCCIISQGAGAVIVTRGDKARDCRQTPVSILGCGEGHRNEYMLSMQDVTSTGTVEAAATAFAQAGVTPAEIDFAEIYDCFTITVLMDLEDLGFCKKGEGGPYVENGRLALDGDLPVNTHGGLLSYCHIGGIDHVVEAARQLRGSCGERQVPDANLGLVTGNGGFLSTKSLVILGKGG
jgi:acetyl-CoA acetyltransferase